MIEEQITSAQSMFLKAHEIFNVDANKVFYFVQVEGLEKESEKVALMVKDQKNSKYRIEFHHEQDCCEKVKLYDFEHDFENNESTLRDDLNIFLGLDIATQKATRDQTEDSGTWTFYRLKTTKVDLFMRWLGLSNGFYSERVDITAYKTKHLKKRNIRINSGREL